MKRKQQNFLHLKNLMINFKRNNDEMGFRVRVEKFKAELLKFMYCCAKDLYEHYHK